MIAYHLDRCNTLKAGDVISLQSFGNSGYNDLHNILSTRYPAGLSSHGDRYYARSAHQKNFSAYLLESFFEYERQLHFPYCISRFQSFFAMESINETNPWIPILDPSEECSIWEVEFDHDNFLRLDSSWIDFGPNDLSALDLADNATKYWSGISSDSPVWELLIHPPVRIIRKISL